ncbi:MAG: hypothetical protein JWP27_1947 [Flaviaesturariibacter sp.]|nr:hypothetical protein [Flaviaesturariibacter sp.]
MGFAKTRFAPFARSLTCHYRLLFCARASMNKTMAFAVFGLLASSVCFSQVQFGIKAGVNRSSLKDDLATGAQTTATTGYHFGAFAHLFIRKNWALQPEIVLSKEGSRVAYQGSEAITELKYANQVLLIQYIMVNGFRVETGAQNGFLFTQRSKTPEGLALTKDDVAKSNLSWVVGLGFMSRFGLGVDVRYNYGLSNDYRKGAHVNARLKSRVGQVGLFYQFRRKVYAS